MHMLNRKKPEDVTHISSGVSFLSMNQGDDKVVTELALFILTQVGPCSNPFVDTENFNSRDGKFVVSEKMLYHE